MTDLRYQKDDTWGRPVPERGYPLDIDSGYALAGALPMPPRVSMGWYVYKRDRWVTKWIPMNPDVWYEWTNGTWPLLNKTYGEAPAGTFSQATLDAFRGNGDLDILFGENPKGKLVTPNAPQRWGYGDVIMQGTAWRPLAGPDGNPDPRGAGYLETMRVFAISILDHIEIRRSK